MYTQNTHDDDGDDIEQIQQSTELCYLQVRKMVFHSLDWRWWCVEQNNAEYCVFALAELWHAIKIAVWIGRVRWLAGWLIRSAHLPIERLQAMESERQSIWRMLSLSELFSFSFLRCHT